jgi:hypothetical protein
LWRFIEEGSIFLPHHLSGFDDSKDGVAFLEFEFTSAASRIAMVVLGACARRAPHPGNFMPMMLPKYR